MSFAHAPHAYSVTSVFGRDLKDLSRRARARYLQKALEYWRTTGFPYEQPTVDQRHAHFRAVANAPLRDIRAGNMLGTSCVGLSLANSYHPQMWHARSHGHRRSPYDYFQDDRHLRAMLERAPRFWPNARCWSPQAVRNLARVYAGGRVANFRPVVARNIIAGFSTSGDVIVDFAAGYGGRLLACQTLRRNYWGIDPAIKQVTGLTRMCHDLRDQAFSTTRIVQGCAEDVMRGMDSRCADLVFSSPPFFNLEIYSDEPTQSSARYTTYGDWRKHFLEVVLVESRRLLRRKGFLAINVSSHRRYPLASDTLVLASRLLTYHCTVHVAMSARPLQRATKTGAYRTEPIYVFRKE